MAKEGSTVSGLMDTFATAISLALQYGVPLRDLVNKFAHVRFEPSGFTGNSEIPIAKSIVDYIFRWLGSRFLVGRRPGGARDRRPVGTRARRPDRVRGRAPRRRTERLRRWCRWRRPGGAGGGAGPGGPGSAAAVAAVALAPEAEEGPMSIDEATEGPAAQRASAVATTGARSSRPRAGAKATLPTVEPEPKNARGNGSGKLRGAGTIAASLGTERAMFRVQEDAPACADCGSIMVRNGSCYKCLNCGSTSGCS